MYREREREYALYYIMIYALSAKQNVPSTRAVPCNSEAEKPLYGPRVGAPGSLSSRASSPERRLLVTPAARSQHARFRRRSHSVPVRTISTLERVCSDGIDPLQKAPRAGEMRKMRLESVSTFLLCCSSHV